MFLKVDGQQRHLFSKGRAAPIAHTELAHQLGAAHEALSKTFGPKESLTGDRKRGRK